MVQTNQNTIPEISGEILSSPSSFLTYLETNSFHHIIENILYSMNVERQKTQILVGYRDFLSQSKYTYKNADDFLNRVASTLKERNYDG